jgi:hypothetical protein
MPTPTRFLVASTLLAVASVAGCKSEPTCYSGTVLGDRCYDGILIQVDEQYRIGAAVGSPAMPDTLGSTNIIAAVNVEDFGSLAARGRRIYFSYSNDPNRQGPARFCNAMGTALGVPHLVLSNISANPCVR